MAEGELQQTRLPSANILALHYRLLPSRSLPWTTDKPTAMIQVKLKGDGFESIQFKVGSYPCDVNPHSSSHSIVDATVHTVSRSQVKSTTKFSKILDPYCNTYTLDKASVELYYDGKKVTPTQTPGEVRGDVCDWRTPWYRLELMHGCHALPHPSD